MKNRDYWKQFTILFFIMFSLCYLVWFVAYKKTFFRSFDGLDQHYLIFLYIGNLLRDFFYNLFVHQQIEFPLWNMGIGYGSDTVTSMIAYLPDPFNWLAVFFPAKFAELGYCLSLTLKVYLSGVVFSWFCLNRGHERIPTLVGSMIYMFGSTTYIVFIESFFINPMYIFPLVIAGFDQLWKDGKSKLYVGALTATFINYFYFAYMTCILVLGYAVIKYLLFAEEKIAFNETGRKIFRVFLFSLIACGVSMVVTLPAYEVISNAGRLGVNYYLPTLFQPWYYFGLLSGFIHTYGMLGRDCAIGFGSMSLIFTIILFIRRASHKALVCMFVLMTLGLGIPYIGHVMNGFSYTANRWVWAYAFCVSYISVVTVPYLATLTVEGKKKLLIGILGYIGTVCLGLKFLGQASYYSLVFLAVISILMIKSSDWEWSKKHLTRWYLILTCFSLVFSAFLAFHASIGRWIYHEVAIGKGYDSLHRNGVLSVLEQVGANSNTRYDEFATGRVRNTSWLNQVSGMDFYISMYNNNVDKFHNDIALMTGSAPMSYYGLNRRSELEYLFNVNYFLIHEKNKEKLPYGFNQLADEKNISTDKKLQVYTKTKETSFVYGFQQIISSDQFKTYSPYDKQQLLMQACVTDGVPNGSSGEVKIMDDEKKYKIGYQGNIRYDNGIVDVKDKNSKIILDVGSVDNSEIYVYFDGIDDNRLDKQRLSVVIEAADEKGVKKNVKETLNVATNRTHMYGAKHRWLVNLGIIRHVTQVVLTFPEAGVYQLKELKVYAKPMEEIEKNINALQPLTEAFQMKNNGFTFQMVRNDYPYALITIPYSKGWRAYVDGQEREIYLADDAFMMLPVRAGDKNVEFHYRTPGLLPGAIISIICLMGYMIWVKKEERCA